MDVTSICKHALLSKQEEIALAKRSWKGDFQARNELINHNYRLVFCIAKYFRTSAPIDDLFQEGVVGLVKAAGKFDPKRGVRFSTFASWWIKQTIRRYLQEDHLIHIPFYLKTLRRDRDYHGKKLSIKQVENLASGERAQRVSTMSSTAMALLIDPRQLDPGPLPLSREMRLELRKLLGCLTPRERFCVEQYYLSLERLTLLQIGKELGVSRQRVCQILAKSLAVLRGSLPADA
jgi:RNA polymerase sigma factor (sigma-70 family)